MRDRPPRGLRRGRIVARRPSHWELSSNEERVRVQFVGKREARFVAPGFVGIQLSADHPVLARYLAPSLRVVLRSAAEGDSARLLDEISAEIDRSSLGWRSLADYGCGELPPAEALERGTGVMLEAPRPVAEEVARLLREAGVEVALEEGPEVDGPVLALILGRSFVIAEHFDFVPVRGAR